MLFDLFKHDLFVRGSGFPRPRYNSRFSYGGNEYFWVAENDTVSHREVRSFPEVRHQGNMATT